MDLQDMSTDELLKESSNVSLSLGLHRSMKESEDKGCLSGLMPKDPPPPDPIAENLIARMNAISAELQRRREESTSGLVDQPLLPDSEVFNKPRVPGGKAGLVLAGVGVAALIATGTTIALTRDDDSEPATLAQPQASASTSPGTQQSTDPSPATSGPLVSGPYSGTVEVKDDPAGHDCCVIPAVTWEILQTRNTETGEITMRLNGVLPGIDLVGSLTATGSRFTATDIGSVAGFDGTKVTFTGTVTPQDGLHGTLAAGTNGTLPQGEAITFTADMQKD